MLGVVIVVCVLWECVCVWNAFVLCCVVVVSVCCGVCASSVRVLCLCGLCVCLRDVCAKCGLM